MAAGGGRQARRWLDWPVNLALRGLIGLALALPYRLRLGFMGWVTARLVGPLAGYTARAAAQLRMVWPDMPAARARALARAVCDNAGRTLIENYSTRAFTARMARVTPTGPGVAALAQARAEGRPVILVTGHFGNYEAGRAALVAQGHPVGGLYREMHNPYFNAHYVRTMEAFGGPVFAQGPRGTAGFVRHLRAGGMLVLLFDQYVGGAPALDFLGLPAPTAPSAAELALRYGAVLIPFYGTRQPDGRSFTVELEAPIPHSDALAMTQAMNDSLSARVRRDPGQWFWIHRRWKPERQRSRAASTT